jgi:hypothetical protein
MRAHHDVQKKRSSDGPMYTRGCVVPPSMKLSIDLQLFYTHNVLLPWAAATATGTTFSLVGAPSLDPKP